MKSIAWTTLALLFLAVSWIWEALAPLVQWVIDLIPLRHLKVVLARFLDRLSPYPTLLIFLIPLVASEAIKLASYWALGHKRVVIALTLFVIAEFVRFSLLAYLFKTCRAKLLLIPWFARLYGYFDSLHQWAHRRIEPIQVWIKSALGEAGITTGRAGFWLRIKAIWRFSRRRSA